MARPTIADQIWSYLLPRKGDYRNPLRWSHENDWWWGPFTFCWSDYNNFGFIISSYGDGEDDDRPASIRIMSGKAVLIMRVPSWLVPGPTRTWVKVGNPPYREDDMAGYWDVHHHEYGFTINGAGMIGGGQHFHMRFGRSTYDSSTDQSWGCFLPWTTWRHVRVTFYDLQGKPIGTVWDKDHPRGTALGVPGKYDVMREIEQRVPKVRYAFKDYDGEELVATCHIEEREWRAGEGWFKWLSWFRKPIIRRSLAIEFSDETGRRKGSWKGGTLGTSIDMERGPASRFWEGPLDAFMRYCREHEMTFTGIVVETGQESANSASHYS